MKPVTFIFPHQLFENHPALEKGRKVLIIEEPKFFCDLNNRLKFHKMKLTFHRASMKYYSKSLKEKGYYVNYVEYKEFLADNRFLETWLCENEITEIHISEVDDYILNERLKVLAKRNQIIIKKYYNPSFLNDHKYLNDYFAGKKSYFQHYFYINQRKKFGILVKNEKPLGGKWSYDSENRKKLPKDIFIPPIIKINNDESISEAKKYVDRLFSKNPGNNENIYLPITTDSAKNWLDEFLENKFIHFGKYQDAISSEETFLFHSLLSPMLNCGLLTPKYVLEKTINFIEENDVPINSAEGFIRQIIGWREFIRAVYILEGANQRNYNFWKNNRKIPKSFYTGTTGIEPIDNTIKKLLETGYNHHIERLMILGNFMLLCEFHPTEVYKWFMEMYIDAYDWVMVPNVYGMSQFADGGIMSTKPYISSSNYIRKMSDYKQGEWTKTWDALYWNFIHKHKKYFQENNRTVFISRNLEKMPSEIITSHLQKANQFFSSTVFK